MTYQVGDIVVRTEGSWRDVNEGDVHTVKSVHGHNICLEGFDGITFDGDNFKKQHTSATTLGGGSQRIEVGSLVRMISDYPKHGAGLINIGDEGVVISLGDDGDYRVKFPRHPTWRSGPDDCELVNVVPIPTPTISIDEAVEACKSARSEIEELESKVQSLKDSIKGYEQVLRQNGLAFI